jgi:mono/diheme cytochrome c family protein
VTHSFYLPDYKVKEDCVPGRETHMWIETKTLGTFNVFCAEFCGKDHAQMYTSLEVVTPEEYEKWKTRMIADMNKPLDMEKAVDPESDEILARDADQLYATYCATCHGENGMGGLVEGARNFTVTEDWKNGPSISGIYTTLTEGIPGGQMRSFSQLSKWDRMALVHKVRSFYPKDELPMDTPEELAQLDEKYELTKETPVKQRLSIEKAMQIIAEEDGQQPVDGE